MTTERPENLAMDVPFDELVAEHAPHMVTKEVIDMMYLLRDFLREQDGLQVTGNGFGLGEADVSTLVNDRHIWIYIRDRTPEVPQ